MSKDDDPFPFLGAEYKELIENVIDILEKLKELDTARLERMLAMIAMTKGLFPANLVDGVDSMETDMKLALIFAQQARAYDQTDKMTTLAKEIEKHIHNEPKPGP